MPINATFPNLLDLIGSLYPLFIVSFLFIASIFNWTILKGLTYLGGIVICFISWILISKAFNQPRDKIAALTCNLFSIPGNYKIPNLPIIITMYTLTYLVIPMMETSMVNPAVILLMSIFSGFNMYYQHQNSCTNVIGILLSIILGILIGTVWFIIFWRNGKRDLLFYNELLSNNVVCNRPKKTTFRCSVYKNGEIISSNIV